jgi:hypothetical protein
MQSTNIRQIKAALWRQAFIGDTWVSCGMGQVVAIRRHKGQLLAMIRGWKRWHAVERVEISESWLVGMVLQARSEGAGTKLGMLPSST